MKKLLAATFVALLMVGCGQSEESVQEEAIDWDDNETRDKIIAEALEFGAPNMPDKELFWKPSLLAPHFAPRKVIVKSTKRLFTGWMKHMHDNGQIKSLKQYKDGRKDGLTIEWYEHGQKRWEETHNGDKLVTAVAWKPNGEKCPETNVVNGNGVKVEYSKSNTGGFLQTYKSTYKDGEIVLGGNQHSSSSWYENGQKRWEETHNEGKLITAVAWRPNGEKCPHTDVVDGNGVWARYNEDGMEKSRDTYKDSKRNGLSTRWDENGQKQEEESWKDGKRDGLETIWYSNGQKRSERNWKDDKLDGVAVFYHESGTESSRYTYKDGKPNGLVTGWYENGRKKEESSYKGGKLVTVVVWKPNGEKCLVTNVVNGNGVKVWYRDDGTEDARANYKYGKRVRDKRRRPRLNPPE